MQTAEHHRHAEPQNALRLPLQTRDGVFPFLRHRAGVPGITEILLTRLGQAQTAGGAMQQLHAQRAFQLGNAFTYRRLGNTQPLAGR
ncbi:hypothetical protein D3C80_1366100 [compost metagenome]